MSGVREMWLFQSSKSKNEVRGIEQSVEKIAEVRRKDKYISVSFRLGWKCDSIL